MRRHWRLWSSVTAALVALERYRDRVVRPARACLNLLTKQMRYQTRSADQGVR